jgi:hypothetical protein
LLPFFILADIGIMKQMICLLFVSLFLSCRRNDACTLLQKQAIDFKDGRPAAIRAALQPLDICGVDSFERTIILAPLFEDTLLRNFPMNYGVLVYFMHNLQGDAGYRQMKKQMGMPEGEFLSLSYKIEITPAMRTFLERYK